MGNSLLTIVALVLLLCSTKASCSRAPLIFPRIPASSATPNSIPSTTRIWRRSPPSLQLSSTVMLVSSSKKTLTTQSGQELSSCSLTSSIPETNRSGSGSSDAIPKWEELPFQWKLLFGSIEIAYTVGTQWISGFATAYILGSVSGVVGLAKPPTDGISRWARWNQRNLRWGKSWGSISASFSGFDTGVRLLRNNKVDEWNSLLGSACAGAFFVRSQGPEAMLKSACLYAAFGYFFLRAGQSNRVFFDEQAI